MELNKFWKDEDAVSPVIGVILMMAITVILAAVVASFVLGIGQQQTHNQPTATFSFSLDHASGSADTLTITHDGGDSIPHERLKVTTDGSGDDAILDTNGNTVQSVAWADVDSTSYTAGQEVTAGTAVTATANSGTSSDWTDETFRVVWTSADGESSLTLGKYSGPDA